MTIDTVIAGGTVVTEGAAFRAHVGIAGGRIVSITDAALAPPPARATVDADGLVVVPGAVDAHTHFTGAHDQVAIEIDEGTGGAAAGGVTTIVEMPHSDPPATTLDRFLEKRELIATHSVVDFAMWGGIDGAHLDQLPLMHRAGAAAMKGFLCSGDPDGKATDKRGLPALNDDVLLSAMQWAARDGGLVGLHSENHAMLLGRAAALKAAGRNDPRAHAESGPEIAEIEAVARVILLARETGAHVHIVHLSTDRAAALIADARASGVAISVETCPQYLVLDEEDLVRIGPNARCGPPIRRRATVEALWRNVLDGAINSLASDHCPYLPEQKEVGQAAIWNAAMGLTGIETMVPLFFAEGIGRRDLGLVAFARMIATAPARIFGLYPIKGAIGIGFDADIVLIDPSAAWTVSGADFRGLGKWSPYEGMTCRGNVVRTLVRGDTLFEAGVVRGRPGQGRFVARGAAARARSGTA